MPPPYLTKEDVDSLVAERNIDGLVLTLRKESTSPEVKDYLVEVLSKLLKGEITFPRRRPPNRLLGWEHKDIAKRVVSLNRYHGWDKIGAAVKQTSAEFNCSEPKVWKCLKEFRGLIVYQMEEDEYGAMIDAAYEARWEAALESLKETHGDRKFSDEEVEAEAEELDQALEDAHPDYGDL